ncbi:MAG: hypothetical protein K9M56_06640 [Victivallales bacterium]|nr:hypothetical protein [Victivallales bacterium]
MKKSKFSLIELLLVMVISAIMLGIVIPTFHKITKGVSVENGARQLGAQLKSVREYAITNRKYVALIFEDKGSSVLPADYSAVAFRPCIVTQDGSDWDAGGNGTDNSNWVEGERWEFLPKGAQIDDIKDLSERVKGITDKSISLDNKEIYPTVVFSPTGKCEGVGSGGATITVGETVEGEGSNNTVSIKIAAYTGRVSYEG